MKLDKVKWNRISWNEIKWNRTKWNEIKYFRGKEWHPTSSMVSELLKKYRHMFVVPFPSFAYATIH